MASELILPYGPAPAVSFIIHEIAMYVLFALCLTHAIRRGAVYVSYLLGGVLFGLLLEYVNVSMGFNYSYGQFWLMLGPTPEIGAVPENIPVNIGVGWGIIIYTARLFSDNLGLPLWSRPALDALLALNIDLSMDAVAYRLNMWHWGWEFFPHRPDLLTSDWFGIPYANFYGWLCVVFFYSAFARVILERQSKKSRPWLRLPAGTVAAIFAAQVALFFCIRYLPGWVSLARRTLTPFSVPSYLLLTIATIIVLAAVVAVGFKQRPAQARKAGHPIIWLVPTYFHIYFLAWLFIAGFYRETFWLPAVSVVSAVIGIVVHQWASSSGRQPETPAMSNVAIEN
jgi:uncharacterized membrane protein